MRLQQELLIWLNYYCTIRYSDHCELNYCKITLRMMTLRLRRVLSMIKVKNLLLILIYVGCSFSAFGNNIKPIICKDFQGLHEMKQKIISMDKTFNWDSKT